MSADRYTSLAALKEQLGEDVFRIRVLDRRSNVTVIAPHGGYIEAGTSAIARAVAGPEYNLFDFQGLRRENPQELHVTATNFRHRRLAVMLDDSLTAVSIHGMGTQHHKDIWLGGLNKQLKQLVLEQLRAQGFAVNPDSPRYRGESPRNVVNLTKNAGVQLELSDELMTELFVGSRYTPSGRCPRTTAKFAALVKAIRDAIALYVAADNARVA